MANTYIYQIITGVLVLSTYSTTVYANESEISALKKRIVALEKLKEPSQNTLPNSTARLYATLRPAITQSKQDVSTTDVTDFLSHAGIYFEHDLGNGWKGIGHGEWSIDISDNGDFGKSRRAYVGLESPYGRVAIGKQRPVQYLLIAEYVDIFDHANAPFAYDNFSPFFVNNLVTYKKQWQHISLLASAQFNGDEGNNNSDMVNIGLSYDKNDLHLAVTYLSQDYPQASATNNVGDTASTVAISMANKFDNGFYIAGAWQQRDVDLLGGTESTQETIDVSVAYSISKNNTLKVGYFDLDDDVVGANNISYQGFNLTLEHQMSDNFQVHGEILKKTFDVAQDYTAFSIGFKYNFSMNWAAN